MSQLSELTAVSPIDGRYYKNLQQLSSFFSEFALIKYRVKVEVEYLLFLAEKGFFEIGREGKNKLQEVSANFTIENAEVIKDIEKTTNHDVKAVEYFLKELLEQVGESRAKEWVHFGLTSQDINNTAIPLLWKDALEEEYLPKIYELLKTLKKMSQAWLQVPMLARTHGQPASPTVLGKEIMVFAERLENQLRQLSYIPYSGKFGGATGNFNAHHVAFPNYDWHSLADEFLEKKLGLERQQYTTQVEHYDMLAAHFDNIKRINNILLDFSRDVWTYISLEYFKQKTKKSEIGSSAMPHKVNPIDFENAEGNLGIANALFEHFSSKLPVSRLQRDLSDSTVLRNIGVPLAHTLLSLTSLSKGIEKLLLNEAKLKADLEQNWAVVAEGIQTILRREGYPNPYEALKELTRGKDFLDQQTIVDFIDSLEVSQGLKDELRKITPHNYTGTFLRK